MICWFCHWGWPKSVADIYHSAVERLHGDDHALRYGPAHIVWDDENFDSANRCLGWLYEKRGDCTDEELEVIRWSLEELLKVPQDILDWPEAYDGNNPEQYPPPDGLEMVRVFS